MLNFKVPLNDMRFVMNEVFDYPAHYRHLGGAEEATPELVDAIMQAAATYSEEVLAPLYTRGDAEGCHFQAGQVSTPQGYVQAYRQFIEGGWQSLSYPPAYGGQGLPMSLNLIKSEMMGTANWAFNMYPGLSIGCINTILQYGTEDIKKAYLPQLISGAWTGTMCLTEPQCGSDLAQVKTQAQPLGDGRYALTGTKIFISSGDHDLTDNIVHIVLARLPDAPRGTRGISLFIVPKFMVNADGSLGARNDVHCVSIEHKLGIKGSPTGIIRLDEVRVPDANRIGEVGEGFAIAMHTLDRSRPTIGAQAVGVAQGALDYAIGYMKERKTFGRPIATNQGLQWMVADAAMKVEAARNLVYRACALVDERDPHGDLGKIGAMAKAFASDVAMQVTTDCVQLLGGYGYTEEFPVERMMRDAKITQIYEGTNQIQRMVIAKKLFG